MFDGRRQCSSVKQVNFRGDLDEGFRSNEFSRILLKLNFDYVTSDEEMGNINSVCRSYS